MNRSSKQSPQRARERALFVYRSAVERGDFEAAAAVLKLAERDPLLDRMIAEMDELDAPPLERPAQVVRPPRISPPIEQIVVVRPPSPDGQTPDSNHHEEEDDMYATYPTIRPGAPHSFGVRFLTALAAAVVLALVGAILIDMAGEPIGGLPIFGAVQTEEPACVPDTVIDMNAESVRLAGEAMALLETDEADRTPEMTEQAALLAICALQTAQTPEADTALVSALRISDSLPIFDDYFGEFSPDGHMLLTADADTRVMRLRDAETGEEIRQFSLSPDVNNNIAFAFSPDGATIFTTTGRDHTARLWDVETGEEIRQFPGSVTGRWESAAFSPDGRYVFAGGGNGLRGADNNPLLMWDVETGEEVRRFVGHTAYIFSVGVSPNGRYVATSSFDNTLRLWDMETGEEIRQFDPYPTWTYGAAFSPDGQYLLSGGGRAFARLFNVETGELVRELRPNRIPGIIATELGRVDYSPDGRLLMTADWSGRLLLWDAETGSLIRVIELGIVGPGFDVATFSPDGTHVLTGSQRDWHLRLWPVSIEDTVALACQTFTRDFTPEERQQYGLGEGSPCPAA